MKKYNIQEIVTYAISTIILLGVLYFIASIDKDTLIKIAADLGPWGIIIFILIILCTQIFAPLSGTAFYFAAIKIYGFGTVLLLFYTTSLLTATISFFIAKRWGRKIVIKLIGSKSMDRIDALSMEHENLLLISGRTIGFFIFDFISYALGFTRISFRKYFWYTALLTIIPLALQYFIFKHTDFNTFRGLSIYYISLVATGGIFLYIFASLMKKNKKLRK